MPAPASSRPLPPPKGPAPSPRQRFLSSLCQRAGRHQDHRRCQRSNKLVIWAKRAEYELMDQAPPPPRYAAEPGLCRSDHRRSRARRRVEPWRSLVPRGRGARRRLSDNSTTAPLLLAPGFNFSSGCRKMKLVISALESRTNVRIVSTPQLTVVDRETATIRSATRCRSSPNRCRMPPPAMP